MPEFMPIIFIAVIALFIVLAIFGARQAKKRREELAAWAASRGLTFSESRVRIEQQFPFSILRKGSDRYAYNTITGRVGSRDVLAFDYHYETESRDSKGRRQTHNHYFSAVILTPEVPIQPLLIRPESFFDKAGEFFGFNDIDFESTEFSRAYFVQAPDKKWAYDVIHQSTMEFLLGSPRLTVEFAPPFIMVRDGESLMGPQEFAAALTVVEGVLDRLPNYLLREMSAKGGT